MCSTSVETDVALTRAKHSLVVIGHAAALSEHPDWRCLVQHARASNRLLDVPRGCENILAPTLDTLTPSCSASYMDVDAGMVDRDAFFASLDFRALSEALWHRASAASDERSLSSFASFSPSSSSALSSSMTFTEPHREVLEAVPARRFIKLVARDHHALADAKAAAKASSSSSGGKIPRKGTVAAPVP